MQLSNKNIFSLYFFSYLLVSFFLLVGYAESEAKLRVADLKPDNQTVFSRLELEAKSAVVYDMSQDKILYSKNPLDSLPLASLAKLMTALVASERAANNDRVIMITKEALNEEGDSGLKSGQSWTLKSLSNLALIASSNDAAAAIAQSFDDAPFVSSMNDEAGRLGLSQTAFSNPTGLDIDENTGGARSSAYDITKLMAYILKNKPGVVEATRSPETTLHSIDNFDYNAKNTNPNVSSLSGVLASKTGFTDLAGGNLTVAFEIGPLRPVILTVLGSSIQGRFDDTLKLITAVKHYYDY